MQKVIGLAGHIDHGKTALVKALTGVDTDRLEEEKRRGVTIDIGIAFYNEEVTFIDVPGHERFIKNMVTGVSTVDAAMLVIAADDGVMPQTREHLDILHLLGVERLVVALNKTDLVDEDWLILVQDEIGEFLSERGFPDVPIIPVSAVKETGIDELKGALDQLIEGIKQQDQQGVFRLPIDRVFSVKGFGTVVTGTVLSHELHKGQNVELFPQQLTFPVRGLQSHHQDVRKIQFGDRGAINLGGASVEELGRGAFLGSPGLFQTGGAWLGKLEVLSHWKRPVKEADRVHIHVGTGKREARVHLLEANQCQPGSSMLAQFFFDEPVSAGFMEPVVIRFLSPEETLGGAKLYWAVDQRIKKNDVRLPLIQKMDSMPIPERMDTVLNFFQTPLSRRELARYLSLAESKISSRLAKEEAYRCHQDRYLPTTIFGPGLAEIIEVLKEYHSSQPLGKGLGAETLGDLAGPTREFILASALQDGTLKNQSNLWQLAGHQGELDESDEKVRQSIIHRFQDQAFSPPATSELDQELDEQGKTILKWMIQHGDLVRLDKDYHLLQTQWNEFEDALRGWFRTHEELSVADLRGIIPSTRKYLLPLLNQAERKALIMRDGDIRRWIGEELT